MMLGVLLAVDLTFMPPSCSLCDYQDEQQKIRFLRGICTLCKCKDTSLNLDAFCRENRLAANVQVGR